MKHALPVPPSADNLKEATIREIERIAQELVERGGK